VDAELIARQNELRSLLGEARVIAVVGISSKAWRPSHDVASYLQEHGYRIIPVNPHETEVLGERVYPTLLDIPGDVHIDVVDVFRRAEHTPEVARDAVAIGARLLWLQEGIVSEEAARIASEGGLDVIMGVCIKKVRKRLMAADAENVAREAQESQEAKEEGTDR
jgi:predicted CoA-binding protein